MKPNIKTGVGASIRITRKIRKMTLDDLATKSGIAKGNLSKIECGKDNMTIHTLRCLATALEVDPGLLLAVSQPPQNNEHVGRA